MKRQRIAVFADLHWTEETATLKGEVLRWAVDEAARCGASAIVCAGDMVGSGRRAEARAVAAALADSPIPVSFTPGNAELRTPAESADVKAILSGAPPPEGVALLDSSAGLNDEVLRAALSTGLLVVTHVPPHAPSVRRYFDSSGPAAAFSTAVVAGHTHRDSDSDGISIVRGLDPDKAQGGPPAFAIFERGADGAWRRAEDCAFPGVAPGEWTDEFRRAFLEDLGLSTMSDPFGTLDFAIANGVACLELRDRTWRPEDAAALQARVADWRAVGGRILSLHLPALAFGNGEAFNVEALRDANRTALSLGCDRVTLHVPKIPAVDYEASRNLMRDAYAEALSPLAGSDIAIGVENMHTTAADKEDFPRRRFGYTPEECARQIELLRSIPGLRVGFHLDIGHARNNTPFSTSFPVGAWYETLGAEVNGMHIHQVKQEPDGTFLNHRPLTGFFEPIISLSSLVMARQRGILPRAPMLLEVREGLGPEAWLALRAGASPAKEA